MGLSYAFLDGKLVGFVFHNQIMWCCFQNLLMLFTNDFSLVWLGRIVPIVRNFLLIVEENHMRTTSSMCSQGCGSRIVHQVK